MKKKSCRRRTKIIHRSKKNIRRTGKRKSLAKGRRRPTRRHSRIQRGGGYYKNGWKAEKRSDEGQMLPESVREVLYNDAMQQYITGADGNDSDSIDCAYRLGRMYDTGKKTIF